jgi:hypothetical protein
MSTSREPNPPSRKDEDFPKTTTIPSGWVIDALPDAYNGTGIVDDRSASLMEQHNIQVPATGPVVEKSNGKFHPIETAPAEETAAPDHDNLFNRRLEPFPSGWDLSGMFL